jgi:hypothetical protein
MEVAIERSFDLVEKGWESKVFLKLYISLRTSGLLADLSDKDLKTLIAIATFMDEEGRCFPSQAALAQALGITRPAVAKRVKSLLQYRWQGKPLVTAQKVRHPHGRFENTVYTVLPDSSLKIFGSESKRHVNAAHMAGGHTNHSQTDNGNKTTVTERPRTLARADDPMADQLAREMRDQRSLAYYRHVVARIPARIYLRVRGEVLEEPKIKKSRGAMFAHLIKKYADQR